MSQNTVRTFIHRNVERQLVREYLLRETERAGFGDLKFQRTPEAGSSGVQDTARHRASWMLAPGDA